MKKRNTQNNSVQKGNEGFALLIGVLMAAVLISITFVMFSITIKQLSLSTSGRNSQTALFAADTGVECALYADLKLPNQFVTATIDFSNPKDLKYILSRGTQASFNCTGNLLIINPSDGAHGDVENTNASVTIRGTTYSGWSTQFVVPATYGSGRKDCAVVIVTKYIVPDTSGRANKSEELHTKIESRGYNTCPYTTPQGDPTSADPQRVERGLEVYL